MGAVFQKWTMLFAILLMTFAFAVPCLASDEIVDQTSVVEEVAPVVESAEALPPEDIPDAIDEGTTADADEPETPSPMLSDDSEEPVSPDEDEPAESTAIVTIPDAEAHTNIPAVHVWENKQEALFEAMREHFRINAVAALPSGENQNLTLRVDWDLNALQTDFSTPGRYEETAPILLPSDAYRFAVDALQFVTIPVIVEEGKPPKKVVTAVEDMTGFLGYAIPQGSDWDEFFYDIFPTGDMRNVVPCTTTDNETIYAHVRWLNPRPDTQRLGVVTVTGELFLPDDVELDEEVEPPIISFPVSIQSTPELNCYYLSQGGIMLPWVIDDELLEGVQVQLRENGGEWYRNEDDIFAMNTGVFINLYQVVEHITYEVQALWDGGYTNIFSFQYNGSSFITKFIRGDRDGGDSQHDSYTSGRPSHSNDKGNQPSESVSNPVEEEAIDQSTPPADELDAENTPSKSEQADELQEDTDTPKTQSSVVSIINGWYQAVRDFFGVSAVQASVSQNAKAIVTNEMVESTNALSGAQMKLMREHGAVRFSEQGITVTFSSEFLDSLQLTDESQLVVKVGRIENGFFVGLTLNGESIEKIPNTTVQMPYTPQRADAIFQLVDEQGMLIDEGEYDSELGIVTFKIQTTGSFHIVEAGVKGAGVVKSETQAESPQPINALPLSAAAVLLMLMNVMIWRKCR